jgi:hypothetical protein
VSNGNNGGNAIHGTAQVGCKWTIYNVCYN